MYFFPIFLGTILFLGLVVVCLILAFQEGLLYRFTFIRDITGTAFRAVRIINAYLDMARPTINTHCSVNDTRKSAVITYTSYGIERLINVPYHRDIKEAMRPWRVLLVGKSKDPVDITQEPGYPYLCSPQELGGREIIAQNQQTNQVISYQNDAPGYLGLARLHINGQIINKNSLTY